MIELKKHIIRSEGFRQKVYRDTSDRIGFEGKQGKLTIGYGYNIDDLGLPEDICMMLLDRKLAESIDTLSQKLPWTDSMDEVRRDVFVEMVYNMGWSTFSAFKMALSAAEREDYKLTAEHMLDSLWAKQVGIRAERMAKMMETGSRA